MAKSAFVIPLNQVSMSARLANWTIKPCSVESNISASSRIRKSRPSDALDGDIMGNIVKSKPDRRDRGVRRVPTHNLNTSAFNKPKLLAGRQILTWILSLTMLSTVVAICNEKCRLLLDHALTSLALFRAFSKTA